MEFVGGLLQRHKYAAMFSVLFLCGLGLPIPEEVTLLASGLAVGWGDADFFLASAACVAGILAGDSIVFALGRYYGRAFMTSRATRWMFTRKRQAKVRALFSQHRSKTVFFARFFAGIRLVVYAYAGQHRMGWIRFLLLDLAGALLSGPTSNAIGWWAAAQLASREEAAHLATAVFEEGKHWVLIVVCVFVLLVLFKWYWWRRSERGESDAGT